MTFRQAMMISIVLFASLAFSPVFTANFKGVPRIVDGDTLAIGSMKFRLDGIDAPETDQVCLNANGIHWTCGIEARDQLSTHIAGREIKCSSHGIDAYRRALATCYLANEDLNGWLVQEGWALAYVKYSSKYTRVEEDARTQRRGLWAGAFIAPWDWRHRNIKTVILGSFSVPIDAQKILLGPSATEGAPSPECTIKGVISRNGERIHHMENQSSHVRIKMDKGDGRRWFCTPEEAEAAGRRRALR